MDKINYPQLTKLNLFYNLVNKLVNLTSWLPNLFWDQGVKKNFMSKNLQRAASILSAVALISWLLIPSSSYIFAEGQCRAGQYNFTKTLYKGMKDPQVKDLQEMLAYCESSDIYPEKVVSGYYGSLTEAAVKRFQKKYGISPVGTFGPLTRAKANSLYGQGAQAQQPQTGAVGQLDQLLQQYPFLAQIFQQYPGLLQALLQPQTGQQPQAQAPTGQVSVSLSPNSPMSGSLIAGSAQVPVLVFTISNGTSGDVTLTGLTFKKVGVVSDINITNGYLAEGNNILSQFSSFSNGVMTFSGNLLTIPAGQSKEVALRLDVSTGATTGQTVSFQLTNVQVSGGQVSANLPLNGGTFTVTQVNNPSLAQISTFTYQGVTSEVDAGTEGVRIFAAKYECYK
jgi:peptidoglycan hydrolase-like protein with peptidoglycan-binding domain